MSEPPAKRARFSLHIDHRTRVRPERIGDGRKLKKVVRSVERRRKKLHHPPIKKRLKRPRGKPPQSLRVPRQSIPFVVGDEPDKPYKPIPSTIVEAIERRDPVNDTVVGQKVAKQPGLQLLPPIPIQQPVLRIPSSMPSLSSARVNVRISMDDDMKSVPVPADDLQPRRLELIEDPADGDDIDVQRGNGNTTYERPRALFDNEIHTKMEKYVKRGYLGEFASDEFLEKLRPYVNRSDVTSFIMNKDKADEPGSHWVAVFINWVNDRFGGPSVEYFDPLGDPPTQAVQQALHKLVMERNPPYMLKFKVNRVRSQRDNSVTCGGHAMRFLQDRYKGRSFKKATNYTITEAEDIARQLGRGKKYRFGFI